MLTAPDTTDEERLLVLASFAALTVEERAELGALAGGALDWPGLWRSRRPMPPRPCSTGASSSEGLLDTVPAGIRDAFVAVTDSVAAAKSAVSRRQRSYWSGSTGRGSTAWCSKECCSGSRSTAILDTSG